MRKLATVAMALLLAAIVVPAIAGDEAVTLEGEIVCAKCSLHEEGREKCQNVLMVDDEGQSSQYYLTKNETNDEYGPVCRSSRNVRVTGQVEEKDGKMWLIASDIEPLEESDEG